MPTGAFSVLLDACVLHPMRIADLMVRVHLAGLVRLRWSPHVVEEVIRSCGRRGYDEARIRRRMDVMADVVEDALVQNYAPLIEGINGAPDPDDRHVIAAAIAGQVDTIVTDNQRDFPAELLANHELHSVTTDKFVLTLVEMHPGAMVRIIHEQAEGTRNPPLTVAQILAGLEQAGLRRAVAELRRLMNPP